MAGQRQHLPVLQAGHLGPQRAQQFCHGADIRQARRIGQRQRLVCQQRGGHQRQAGILCPGNGDLPFSGPFPVTTIESICLPFMPVSTMFIGHRGRAAAIARPRLFLALGDIRFQGRFQPLARAASAVFAVLGDAGFFVLILFVAQV
jgi:hypothetical protein